MEWVAAKESVDRYMSTLDIGTSKQKIMTARDKLMVSIVNGNFQWRKRLENETKYHGMDIVVRGIKCGECYEGYRVGQLYGTWSVDVYFVPRVVCIVERQGNHKTVKIVEYKGK